MKIRQADAADLPWVTECAEMAYRVYEERLGLPPAPKFTDYNAQVLAGILHIIEDNLIPRGFIVLYPHQKRLFIESVAVHPMHQGAGYGKELFKYAEAMAKRTGFDSIELYTNEHMRENLKIFVKLGYRETDRVEAGGYKHIYFNKTTSKPD
ncbi:GNAT family N-acetyltransferase [Flexibacterium corallicola]|uniref:GNAT family N-acetyltransferase n=1 Tax=Flexibacterium corallicola TaxID=3037259 RepID=UPI00286F4210|nr:GNAT family N-acetyltransferase [Pseudovibrio sp. M1P-2-3]